MSTEFERFALNGPTMGTRWSAVFHATKAPDASLTAALQAAVDGVDSSMSTWKPDSELMRLNQTPPGTWMSASPQLCAILALSLQIGQASQGAFDIGVGAAVNAWGFGPARPAPDSRVIAALTGPQTALTTLEVDIAGGRLRRLQDVQLDLCGIAKGHGVDCLADVLLAEGIENFVVSIDGEVRVRGTRPDGSGWVVGLERPERDKRILARTIAVSDLAMATSGDYRHFRSHGYAVVSHTIDPRSGAPLQGSVCAVTVTAEHCAVADAWATALMVLGETAGPAMADQLGLDALFTLRRPDGFHDIGVGAFAALSNPSIGGN